MVKRYNRLLVTFYVISDSLLAMTAFALAYVIRFETGLVSITKGYPAFDAYLKVLLLVGLLVPIAFQLINNYRLRRSRTRVDDFFSVFVGNVIAVVLGLIGTLYFQAYYVSPEVKELGTYEISRLVWGIFLIINIAFTYVTRDLVRNTLERRWRAGIGLKRTLIAGTGDLARLVTDKVIQHRELGYKIIGFVDDQNSGSHLGHRGLPILGTLNEASDVVKREKIDQLYVALPLENHVKMLGLMEMASRECIDVKVVPDLLQFIALRARLEDLDGVPIININDVPMQGLSAGLKRVIDSMVSALTLVVLSVPFAIIATLVKTTSKGPIFYRQERMGLDGKPFTVYKFRSMSDDAERETGPVWTSENDPRRTKIGKLLRRFSLDELPQLWNVVKGEMSLVGPRPERPFFVEQFKRRVPQYMLRHKVKSGMTGWAQVNGWRGNTSIEKRIEYDLYYIENWSVSLDLKIIWLTLSKGFFHRHAY